MADPAPGHSSADALVGNETIATPDSTLHVKLPIPKAGSIDLGAPAELPPRHLGPYTLLEKLGEGGMGAVWKARHMRLDKLVALKQLPPHLTSDPEAVQRFEREMRAVGKLEHPHIVRAMDAGEVNGVHYLAMELVEGLDLARVVKDRGPLPIAEACRCVGEAALGVAHAHAHGMVHRDLKPSNLLLSPADGVKILDLGLARLHDDHAGEATLTATGVVVGTPDFMAPEQWDNSHAVGPAADLYSLGCTLFFLLTGRPPFSDGRHTTHAQKMKAHLLQPPPKPSELRPEIPPELDRLLGELLAKEPTQRLASAEKLAERLSPFAGRGAHASAVLSARADQASLAPAARPLVWIVGLIGLALIAAAALLLVPRFLRLAAGSRPPRPTAPTAPGTSADVTAPAAVIDVAAIQTQWAGRLGCDVDYTNSLGMQFRLVPPGKFQMGTDDAEIAALISEGQRMELSGIFLEKFSLESPRHLAAVSQALYVGVSEVTQEQYAAVMGNNPAYYSPQGDGKLVVAGRDTTGHPVESVSWHEALAFCAKLSEREARPQPDALDRWRPCYRLPTEAEWEYACRAGTDTRFAMGADTAALAVGGWFADNSSERTSPAATRQPNAFGLCDMHGNVWEWCLDGWDATRYPVAAGDLREDPFATPEPDGNRIARGGSWQDRAIICRSANRGTLPASARGSSVGFRIVLPIEPPLQP